MNFWNDEMFVSDCYGFCQLSPLASSSQDFYVFEGYDVFSEAKSHLNSSFTSSNIQDDQHYLHISSDQSSSSHEFSGERFWPQEELMKNENKKVKSKSTTISKKRTKWTEELHQKFVECVNQLGGARKATPKQLVHLMKTKGLTSFHVKSHLQKYRISQSIQESSEGKSGKKTNMEAQPNQNIGKQLMEAVRQQLDVQSSLNEQLEVQKNLISAIEEQTKQLRRMLGLRRNPVEPRNNDKMDFA